MAFDLPTLARTIHIITAALWMGGAFFMAFILGPSMRAAGPAAGPLMMTVLRRGGLAWYFLSMGGTAIVAGLYLYMEYGYAPDPFGTAASTVLTVGVVTALLAYGHGLGAMLPSERKIKRLVRSMKPGPPSADEAAQFQAFGMKQGKHSAISAAMITLTFVLMVSSRLFL